MNKLFFQVLLFSFLVFFQPRTGEATFLGGTYFAYEIGNNDYYAAQPGGDGIWASEYKFIFDGAGNFSAVTLADSDSELDTFDGTYTVTNGVLTISVEGETLSFRIAPDGETLANITAIQSNDPEIDNETLRLLVNESNVSTLSGTYYAYEIGNNDYYAAQLGGDGFWTSEYKFIFDGAGSFSAQTLADSDSEFDTFNGTYTVANGVLTISVEGETLSFRITPDGENIANVTAVLSESPDIDNEVFRLLVKTSESTFPWTMFLPTIIGGQK